MLYDVGDGRRALVRWDRGEYAPHERVVFRAHVAWVVVADEVVLRERRLRADEAIQGLQVLRLVRRPEGGEGLYELAVAQPLLGDDLGLGVDARRPPEVRDGEDRLLGQRPAPAGPDLDAQ